MQLFRNNNLRKLIAVAILFTSLLVQIRVVYACAFMENATQTSCCCEHREDDGACPMGDSCNYDIDNSVDKCCAITVAVANDLNLTNADNTYPPEATIFITHYSPLAFESHPAIFLTGQRHSRVFLDKTDASWQSGTNTYLITLRIRK